MCQAVRRAWRYTESIRKRKKTRQQNGQKKKDKQRSTKHTHKTKDRVTRTPLKTGGERRCSRWVGSSCSTSGTRRVNLVCIIICLETGKAYPRNYPIYMGFPAAHSYIFYLFCNFILVLYCFAYPGLHWFSNNIQSLNIEMFININLYFLNHFLF